MRTWNRTIGALSAAALACVLTGGVGRAEDQSAAPADPTRGQWDSFLDPLRDVEDEYVTAFQKKIEDSTKIHLSTGLTQAYLWDFNDPGAGSLIPLHSMEHHNDGTPAFGQIAASRPSEGWFIPGFGLKLDYGKGARNIKADWNGDGAINRGDIFETNDFDAEEAYLTWTMPDDGPSFLKGLSVKGGKFVTLLGAEVIEPWANFNYSRSLLFSLAIPFTHTGVLVSYPITEKLQITGGPVVGWDKVTTNNNGWSGLGNLTYTANEQLTLAGNLIFGPEQSNKVGPKREVVDLVATYKPAQLPALTLLLNYDYGHEDNAAIDVAGNAAFWQGLAAVGNYNLTDRASVAVRGEWFEDHGGSRTGLVQTVYEGTITGKYLITQHLYGQVEYRHDESGKRPFATSSNTIFLPGQDILGFDVTYVFN